MLAYGWLANYQRSCPAFLYELVEPKYRHHVMSKAVGRVLRLLLAETMGRNLENSIIEICVPVVVWLEVAETENPDIFRSRRGWILAMRLENS